MAKKTNKKESEALDILRATTLNFEQEKFVRLYTTPDTDTFFNATLSYAEAYGFDFASLDTKRELDEKGNEILGTSDRERAYSYCATAGSRLMKSEKIQERKNELMMLLFNDDKISDTRLQEIIVRGSDANAINAIKHRNELKQRLTKKVDISVHERPLAELDDEELEKLAELA